MKNLQNTTTKKVDLDADDMQAVVDDDKYTAEVAE
jgi:hypothetical protein